MKKNKILILTIIAQSMILAQDQTDQTTPVQALAITKQRFADVKTIADPLFNPVTTETPVKPNPYPTQSINEPAINTLFGQQLNVNPTLLQHIKNCYFYIEYIAKLEFGARIAAYAKQNSIDVISILSDKGWKDLVNAVTQKAGSWSAVLKALEQIERPAYDIIKGTINIKKWQDIINTPFWKNISLTNDQIINSSFWQKYLKYTVVKSFQKDKNLLGSIFDAEERIFIYIPNIEIAYYNADFEHLRNSSEFFRLSLVLTDALRDRYIRQTVEWQNFINPTSKQIDLIQTYSAALEFQQSNFYTLAELANQPLEQLVKQIQDKTLKITNTQYAQEPMAQTELAGLAMIQNVQAQLQYLFDGDNLDKTMQALESKTPKPTPSILLYGPDEYLYLEDLATLLQRFQQAAPTESDLTSQKIVTGGRGDDQVNVQDFGSWLSDKWDDIKDDAKKTGKAIIKTGKDAGRASTDVWQGIEDETKAIGMGGAAIAAYLTGNPKMGKQLLKASEDLQKKVSTELKQTLSDVQTVFNDTEEIAKDAVSTLADATTAAIGALTCAPGAAVGAGQASCDPKFADALGGALKSAGNILIDIYAELTVPIVAAAGELIYLTEDAISIAAEVTTNAIIDAAKGKWQDLGSDVLDGLETLAADTITSLWSTISFVGSKFIDQLKDTVALVGYIAAALTDMTIDVWQGALKGLATLAGAVGWDSGQDALKKSSQWIGDHRRTITTLVTTALLVAAVIATDGAALPMIAMTVGPQVFQIGGAYQSDVRAAQLKAQQGKFLDNYTTFINNNKTIYKNSQDATTIELTSKLEAQITNQERELGFYQNFLNNYFASTKEQMSFYLGSNLSPQLQLDDKYQVRYADIGSLYGFKTGNGDTTGVLNLNPSQGFPLYNKARDTYSQEIAVYPALSMQSDNQKETSKVKRKFWFNQKETMPLANEINEVEIRWQAIYLLNSFHIGLYFGGQPIDIQQIRTTKKADIDAGHLAKMLVYKKDDKDQPITLNLYEHEGKGWFDPAVNGPAFSAGVWYRMKMQLNNTNLKLKVWRDGDPEPNWQSFTVSKTPQKTIGVISSGASIQYQIIKPKIEITNVTKLRGEIDWKTEQNRKKINDRIIMQQLLSPTIGSFTNLQPVGKPEILKGQFIYNTKATKLKDAQEKPIDDYVILGVKGTAKSVDELGASPRQEIGYGIDQKAVQIRTDAQVVSLISGNAFNTNGSKFTTLVNVLNTYTSTHGPLADELSEDLQKLKVQYLTTQMGPFNFGAITLNATSIDELKKSQFIYQAISPEKELRDAQGNPIKDAQDKSVYDYFLMVNKNNLLGDPYNTDIDQIRSIVTGNDYNRTSNQPVDTGYETGTKALQEASDNFKNIRPALQATIDLAVKTYNTALKKEQEKGKPLNIVPVNSGNASSPAGAHSSTITGTAPIITVKPADESLQKRNQDASANETSWGD